MLWRLSLPAKHWLSFFFFLVILKKWREEWALQPTLLCSVNFACHCPPSETASLFYQSSPSALCLAFGAGMCATSKRAGITMVFFLRFFFFFFSHASRHVGSSFSSSSDKGEPRLAAVEVWSLNHWTAREVLFFIHLQCGRPGFNPWVGKIPWKRERLPTPVFWPGEFPGVARNSMELQRIRHDWVDWVTFTLHHNIYL